MEEKEEKEKAKPRCASAHPSVLGGRRLSGRSWQDAQGGAMMRSMCLAAQREVRDRGPSVTERRAAEQATAAAAEEQRKKRAPSTGVAKENKAYGRLRVCTV
eukprot:5203580-Prymnesium_polylepis.1